MGRGRSMRGGTPCAATSGESSTTRSAGLPGYRAELLSASFAKPLGLSGTTTRRGGSMGNGRRWVTAIVTAVVAGLSMAVTVAPANAGQLGSAATAAVPRFDHVILIMMEN